jgi:hypothetical protein
MRTQAAKWRLFWGEQVWGKENQLRNRHNCPGKEKAMSLCRASKNMSQEPFTQREISSEIESTRFNKRFIMKTNGR